MLYVFVIVMMVGAIVLGNIMDSDTISSANRISPTVIENVVKKFCLIRGYSKEEHQILLGQFKRSIDLYNEFESIGGTKIFSEDRNVDLSTVDYDRVRQLSIDMEVLTDKIGIEIWNSLMKEYAFQSVK